MRNSYYHNRKLAVRQTTTYLTKSWPTALSTLSQISGSRIRQTTLLNYKKFADLVIFRLWNCDRDGRGESKGRNVKGHWDSVDRCTQSMKALNSTELSYLSNLLSEQILSSRISGWKYLLSLAFGQKPIRDPTYVREYASFLDTTCQQFIILVDGCLIQLISAYNENCLAETCPQSALRYFWDSFF